MLFLSISLSKKRGYVKEELFDTFLILITTCNKCVYLLRKLTKSDGNRKLGQSIAFIQEF